MNTSVKHFGHTFLLVNLGLVSTSALAFEINLSRFFSVAHFYHFSFMIVSLALLGYGASGTYWALFPVKEKGNIRQKTGWIAFGQAITILGSYLYANQIPFDSFSIAWDPKQILLLGNQFICLAMPFFFHGLAVSLILADETTKANKTYAANMLGSSMGCLIAFIAIGKLGIEGTVMFCCSISALAAIICFTSKIHLGLSGKQTIQEWIGTSLSLILIACSLVDFGARLLGRGISLIPPINISPYKALSQALQVPGAKVINHKENSYSRIDVVRGASTRSFPGLSYRCMQEIPTQDGLLVDGNEISPIINTSIQTDLLACLPGAAAYRLRPKAETLIIEPRGGLEIIAALSLGSIRVRAVESNPLIVEAANEIYSNPKVLVTLDTARSYFNSTDESFNIIAFPLTAPYHPILSGYYSLTEDYIYTIESFSNALARLKPDGILVVTRWMQKPPSEELKIFALVLSAIEESGGVPDAQIAAFRGYNTVTILAKKQPFSEQEWTAIYNFCEEKAFDLVYAQGLSEAGSNRYNIMPEAIHFRLFYSLANPSSRQIFSMAYPYDVSPPTDDHPFFSHYFKWSQFETIMENFGKTMQPFGGAGYLAILGLLVLSIILATSIIILPLWFHNTGFHQQTSPPANSTKRPVLRQFDLIVYFGMLGLGYLLVEIPLIQQFILFLGHPTYAMTSVLFTILAFSAIGSAISKKFSLVCAMVVLIIFLLLVPISLPVLFNLTLGFSLPGKLLVSIAVLAPLGFLMGIPFPSGITRLSLQGSGAMTPWAWGINGAASVIASILAALLAISLGFRWVFLTGALCYAIALIMGWLWYRRHSRFPHL